MKQARIFRPWERWLIIALCASFGLLMVLVGGLLESIALNLNARGAGATAEVTGKSRGRPAYIEIVFLTAEGVRDPWRPIVSSNRLRRRPHRHPYDPSDPETVRDVRYRLGYEMVAVSAAVGAPFLGSPSRVAPRLSRVANAGYAGAAALGA
ncbi:MAG TPA: hypothetical protein VLA19_12790 [Herpetosiphonaceae bacterium]|nr:hypothetical protein [Herpetosiphonaceae bacterium]